MDLDTCTFCYRGDPIAVYAFPPIEVRTGRLEDHGWMGGEMAACRGCAWWIDRGDVANLIDRVARRAARHGVNLPYKPLAFTLRTLFESTPTPPPRRSLGGSVPTAPSTAKPIELPPLHPRKLPKVRDRLVTFWRTSASIDYLLPPLVEKLSYALSTDLAYGLTHYIDRTASHAEKAQLFWVDRDFTTLAAHASTDLPDVPMQRHEPLATEGVLMWQTPICHIPNAHTGLLVPIVAAQWGPITDGILMTFYTRADVAADSVHKPHRLQEIRQGIGWLAPVAAGKIEVDETSTPKYDTPGLASMIKALRATWIVSQIPSAEVCDQPVVAKATRKAYSRTNRTPPMIRLVRLRPKKQTHKAGSQNASSNVRTHQWWVEPFWRMQRVGPGRARRELRYVIGHRRGPEGAPLRITKKVNIVGDPNTSHPR